MDRIWVATASLIYPEIKSTVLVSYDDILNKVNERFPINITPIMLTHHLVSWEDRQADKKNPKRGGSRNRYLFCTLDGYEPIENGFFRLYKKSDSQFDGWDKTGKIRPENIKIPPEFRYLIDWHENDYFGS